MVIGMAWSDGAICGGLTHNAALSAQKFQNIVDVTNLEKTAGMWWWD